MIVTAGPLLVVSAYPELTLPQGDDGNCLVLVQRARARGIDAQLQTVHCGEPLPPADVYVAGGLEDEDAGELARWLAADGALLRAVAAGAAVLGVTTGYQVLGRSFELPDGSVEEGLGLLDVRTRRGDVWIDGPVVTRPDDDLGLPALSGYESHYGVSQLGEGAAPLAVLEIGHGNGPSSRDAAGPRAASGARGEMAGAAGLGEASDAGAAGGKPSDAVDPATRRRDLRRQALALRRRLSETPPGSVSPQTDGAIAGRVVGTYLHGPVLARNPELADLLLGRVLGRDLDALPSSLAEEARRRRIEQARDWAARGRPAVKM